MTIAKRWFGPIRSSRTDVNGTLYTNGQGTCCGCPYFEVDDVTTPSPAYTMHAEGLRSPTGMLPFCNGGAFKVFGLQDLGTPSNLKSADSSTPFSYYNPIEDPVLRVEIDSLPTSILLTSGGHDYEVFGWDTFNGTYDYGLKRSQWGCLMAVPLSTGIPVVGCGTVRLASTYLDYANAVERDGTAYDVTLIMRIFHVVRRPVITASAGPQNSFGEVSVIVSFCLFPNFNTFVLGDPMPALPMLALEATPGAGMKRALTYDTSNPPSANRAYNTYVSDNSFSLDATNMLTGITGQLVEQCVNGTCADGANAGTITVSVFDNA